MPSLFEQFHCLFIRLLVLFICATTSIIEAGAQCSGVEGVFHFGSGMESGHSIASVASGGYLLSGTTESFGAGMKDWLVIKTDENFSPIWSRAIGYPSTDELGVNVIIKEFSTGEIMLSGYQFISGHRGRAVLLDQNGIPLWTLAIDGSQTTPREVVETPDGKILISGTCNVPAGSSDDAFILKVDFDGNVEWCNRFDGGINDHFQSVTIGVNGNYFAVGNSMGYNGTHAGHLVEMSPDGTVINQRIYNVNSLFAFLSVVNNPDGSFLLTGLEIIGSITNGMVMKINQDFSIEWARRIRQGSKTYISFAELWDPNEVIVGLSNLAGLSTDNMGLARLDYMTGEILEVINPDEEFAHAPEFTTRNFVRSPENGVIGIGTHNDLLSVIGFNNCLEFECMNTYDYITSDPVFEVVDFSIPSSVLGTEIIPSPSSVPAPGNGLEILTPCGASPCVSNPNVANAFGCVDEPVSYSIIYDDIIPGDIQSIEWDFGSGITSNAQNPVMTYDQAGVWPFTLTIITSNDCEYVMVGETQIEDVPDAPQLTESITLCTGESEIIDFDQFGTWDSIVGPDGLHTGLYEFNSSGAFPFDFYASCANYSYVVDVEIINNENLLSLDENIYCLGEELEVIVNLMGTNISDTDLSLNFGDGFEAEVVESPLYHDYLSSGNYTLTLSGIINDCPVNESIGVEIDDPIIFILPPSLSFCENESGFLDFSDYDFNVQNSEGQYVTVFESFSSGAYTFSAQNVCGLVSQTVEFIQIEFDPVPFGNGQVICPGKDTVHIGFQNEGYLYDWNAGSSNSDLYVSSGGQYTAEVTMLNGSCSETYTFNISEFSQSNQLPFPEDTITLCEEGSRYIHPAYTGFPYTFPDGSTGFGYLMEESGTITVAYSDGCYDYEASTEVIIDPCLCTLFVPNAFTPNEDGLNDLFHPTLDCPVESFEMIIFNRWGQEVFVTNDISKGWNGQSPNQDFYASEGVYYYIIRYSQMLDDLEYPQELAGHCSLIR